MQAEAIDEEGEDVRIEGTTSYLPPEVVLGAFPTIAADAWALGCVTYQCLTGRPPILETDDNATRNRIVRFDLKNVDANGTEVDRLFDDKHASAIKAEAREMIRSLLDREPMKRPDMTVLAEHSFFQSNVFALYHLPAYPLDVGSVAPSPNAHWARRQYSSIWAPQPDAYNVTMASSASESTPDSTHSSLGPIREGEEASGFFSPSGRQTTASSSKSAERYAKNPLLPPI